MERPSRIFVMRHAERVNAVYGRDWVNYCFNEKGEYIRTNLNLPKSLPKCKSKETIHFDPPLSTLGEFEASQVGEAMAEHKLNIRHVFCSPALRCIQTCFYVLKEFGKLELPVNIEPGFTDLVYTNSLMTTEQTLTIGLNIQQDYQPLYTKEEVMKESSFKEFIERLDRSTKHCVDVSNNTGDMLIVGHGWMLNLPIQEDLVDGKNLDNNLLYGMLQVCPGVSFFELKLNKIQNKQQQQQEKEWEIINAELIRMKFSHRRQFDWKVLHGKLLDLMKTT